ncbi:hypothetical protein ILUMI_20845 [Ignelater luminosus]|uniref:MADF domain-containing protein n=1 Tax=Ignelater luminosus TaxID=2038154 RepID=A0A8K0G4G5_IGNLU|nr:hypothetical protein ILUMI_20845 [Ignelater luminosus]
MGDDILQNVKFVKEVQKHECIWNYNVEGYGNREVTTKAWDIVSNECNEPADGCRERWRNIRTTFLRSLKRPSGKLGAKKNRPYYLTQYLQFLLPFIKAKHSSIDISSIIEKSEVEIKEYETPTIPVDPLLLETASSSFQSLSSPPPQLTNHEAVSTPSNLHHKKKIMESTVDPTRMDNKERRNDTEDANLLFLKSLLPDIRQMNDKQNRKFRVQVINLIDDILQETDSIPTSNFVSMESHNSFATTNCKSFNYTTSM